MLDIFARVQAEVCKCREAGEVPTSIAVTYAGGVRLLEGYITGCSYTHYKDAQQMLMRGDRVEITEYLNNTSILGLKIIVADIVMGDTDE
jgi:hypothetical protein